MEHSDKLLSLLLIVLLALLSAVTVQSVLAQVPTPSVPNFTVTFIPSSFLVGGTATTNPYTGQNQTTPTYRVWNSTIQLTIQNQPAYSDGKDNLYYNVRMKGHFEGNWTEIYQGIIYPLQSNTSNITVILYEQNGIGQFTIGNQEISLPEGSQLDFQVQAEIGFFTAIPYGISGHPIPLGTTEVLTVKASSGWSNTQTVTLSSSAPAATLTTPKDSMPSLPFSFGLEQIAILVLVVIVAIMLVVVAVLLRRKERDSNA